MKTIIKQDRYWGNTTDTSVLDSNDNNENQVHTSNNRVYFYSEVTRPDCLALNKSLQTLADSMTNTANNYGIAPPPINLHINSYGGSVFAGLSSVDYIASSRVPIHTIVEGCAASAATIMSVVAEKRYMRKNAFMLIHQLSSGFWGKFEELKDDMKNCEILMDTIKEIYVEHTTIPKKKLNDILKHDLWFDADTCLEYGLVDELIF